MKPSISPLVQVITMTVYGAIGVGLIYGLFTIGVPETWLASLAIGAVAIGLLAAVYLVGIYSWAILTALAWLLAAVIIIFQYG